jgi:ABC-2 type transport system permease protein
MPRSTFNETLRRGCRGMIFWGLGLGLLGFVITVIIPNMDVLKQFQTLMSTMPGLVKALGMEDAGQMMTPEGLISAGYFGRVLLIVALYAVFAGLDITANDEDAGIMDMLLSLPVPRSRIILEKFMAYTLMLVVIVALGFVGIYLSGVSSPLQVNTAKLLVASINVLPSSWLMLAFTMFAATFFRRKSQATAMAAFFIIGSYVLDLVSSLASESPIARLRILSFFAYYDNAHVMQTGLNVGNILLLLGTTLVLVVASVWCFQRRDIGG